MVVKYETLDINKQLIVDQYDENIEVFNLIRDVATKAINEAVSKSRVEITAVESRLKRRDSLIEKLVRKGQLYNSIFDLTDIFGARIITLFGDDVDRVASVIAQTFDVDWKRTTDKRKMHSANSFGYNSLHYICSIPASMFCDSRHPEINNIKFEIQMRSTLQHAWAAMEHDIGYKSEIETPSEYQRMFGRLAGLLELADEEFSRIRMSVTDYRRRMTTLIKSGDLAGVKLDGDTFASYIARKPFDRLMRRIVAINQCEVQDMPFFRFFPLLKETGVETLQDVEKLIHDNEDDAYELVLHQLAGTDIDIVASTIALQNILVVAALKRGGGKPALKHIYDTLNGSSPNNESVAELVYNQACKLSFMKQ